MVPRLGSSELPTVVNYGRDDAKEVGEGPVEPCLACAVCSGLTVWLGPSGFPKSSNNERFLPQVTAQ